MNLNVKWQSNKVFFLFFIGSLVLSVVISVLFVGQRADTILLKIQKSSSNYEASQALSSLEQYLNNRYKILKDIARTPLVANSVMGSDMELANLEDYLENLTILGEKESIQVINILGNVIYPKDKQGSEEDYSNLTWFSQISEGDLEVKYSILNKQGQHFFKIAVPIIYNGLVEGLLTVRFAEPLKSIFTATTNNNHAVRVSSTTGSYQSFEDERSYQKISNIAVGDTQLILEYFIKQDVLNHEKRGFMLDIGLSVVLSIGISFLILGIFGKRYIVNPFKRLAAQEKETRESEERFQLAVEGSKDGIWDWDLTHNSVYFSDNFKVLLGFGNGENQGEPHSFDSWQDLIHPDDLSLATEKLNQHLSINSEYDLEYRLRKGDGSYGHFRVKGTALRNSDGQPLRMAGSLTDVSQNKIAKLALAAAKEQNELLAQAIEATPIGISISDAREEDLPLIYVNDGFTQITGYKKEDVLGKNCRVLQGKETNRKTVERFRQAIKNQQPIVEELLNYRKDGTPFWNTLHISPILDDSQQLIAYVGVQKDITERKEFENKLELARIEAESANQTKSNFLASMSHEIRTPMNGVLGMLDLLQDEPLTPDQSQKIRIAATSARSLLTVINDVLDFSKIEAGKLTLEKVSFDARELIEECSESAAVLVAEKDIELVVDTCGIDYPDLIGDPNRIRQVLTNILGNAIKFTTQGEVIVTAWTEKDGESAARLCCRIKDTGIGIEQHKISKLFESFTQADDSTTRRFGGTGLGLAIVKKLCQLMKGEVNVKSEVGSGSTFEFHLGCTLSTPSECEQAPEHFEGFSAFVIGDNSSENDSLCKVLEFFGVGVVHAESPRKVKQAIERLIEKRSPAFDLLFVSDNADNNHGLTICKALQSTPIFANSTVILLTAFSDHEAIERMAGAGVNGYALRPITHKDILGALRMSSQDTLVSKGPTITRNYVTSEQMSTHATTSLELDTLIDNKILLVEDNEINQIVAISILQKFGFTNIMTAVNGIDAITKLSDPNHSDVSIILMDCQMPEMDGYQASENIRKGVAGDIHKNTPIIAMTANAMKGDKEKCLAAGMNDYLSKPVDESVLIAILSTWLSPLASDKLS